MSTTTFVNIQTSAETFSEPLPFQHFLGDYAGMSSASPRPGPDSATTPALCDQACRADASCEVWKSTPLNLGGRTCQLYDISGNQQSGIKINPTLRSTGSAEIYSNTVPVLDNPAIVQLSSSSQCETVCNSQSGCGAYTFDSSLNTCTLFAIGPQGTGNVGTSRSLVNLPTLTITGTPTVDIYDNVSLTFTTTDATSVNLSWTPNNGSLQSISSPFNQKIISLVNGTQYTFTLTVTNTSGVTRSRTFTLTVPSAFVNLTAKLNASGSVTLKADSSLLTGSVNILGSSVQVSDIIAGTTFKPATTGSSFSITQGSDTFESYTLTQGNTQEIIIDSASQYLNTIRINSTPYGSGLTTSSIKYTGSGQQSIIVSDDLSKIFVQDSQYIIPSNSVYVVFSIRDISYISFYTSPNLLADDYKKGIVLSLPTPLSLNTNYTIDVIPSDGELWYYNGVVTYTFTTPQAAVNYGTSLNLPIFGAPMIKVEQLLSDSMTYYIQIPEAFLPQNVNNFIIGGDVSYQTGSDATQYYSTQPVSRTDLIKGLRITINDPFYFTIVSGWDTGKKITQNSNYSWRLLDTGFSTYYITNINFDTNPGSIGLVTIPSNVSVRAYKSDDLSVVSDVFTVTGLTTPSFTSFSVSAISTTSITFSGNANLPGFSQTDTIDIIIDGTNTVITTCTFAEFTTGVTKTVSLSSGSITLRARVTVDQTIVSNSVNATIAESGPIGGDKTTVPISGRTLHSFTRPGTYTFTTPINLTNVSILIVGGGGGGGGCASNVRAGGGGGAGGLIVLTSQTFTAGSSVTVTVGSKGSGGNGTNGTNGGDSSVTGFGTAYGGQGGAGTTTAITASSTMGSGGGGSSSGSATTSSAIRMTTQTLPTATPSQSRNRGGNGYYYYYTSGKYVYAGGGGGGSGAVGSAGFISGTSNGGSGTINSITGSSVTYAVGGGGGICDFGGTIVTNPGSYGGNGQFLSTTGSFTRAISVPTNPGCGGGGAAASTGVATGGDGSDGVVYISY